MGTESLFLPQPEPSIYSVLCFKYKALEALKPCISCAGVDNLGAQIEGAANAVEPAGQIAADGAVRSWLPLLLILSVMSTRLERLRISV